MADTDAKGADTGGVALFVSRPILAFVVSALILIAGAASLFGVEVRELPSVSRPVVTLDTDFPGAAPETVDQELTGRIEGAVGQVAGLISISSSSSFGESDVTLEFADGTDIDVAAADTREAVAQIADNLPDGVEPSEIVKADTDADPILRLAVTSATRSPQDLTQIVNDLVEDRVLSVQGVAALQVYGDRDPIFRVDIDQGRLASRGLTLADIADVLSDAAFDAPAGDLSGARQTINVRTTAALSTPEAFENLRIAENVRLRDVATVTLGPAPDGSVLRANGETGLGMGVIRQAASNTLEISDGVRAALPDIRRALPDDVSIFITSDDAVFIRSAIAEVVKTLGLSTAIVVVIIYAFLRDARATLIPALTMPVALIGTLAAIYMAGFSVNILTLLALVLATGLVVDDAIVVLENIVRRRSQGMGPRAAAVLGTRQVVFAVITTTATLAAVFVPLSFLPGQAGGLFREFGFTLAMAVLISSLVALTLCPVLASRLLRADEGPPKGPVVWLGDRFAGLYRRTLNWALSVPFVIVLAAALFSATAYFVLSDLEQELTPTEDRAVALMSIRAPQGVALDYTIGKMAQIEERVQPLVDDGSITNVFSITGWGSNNRGFMVMTLADWGDRSQSQQEIVAQIEDGIADIVGVSTYVIQPNSLDIRGGGRGLSFAILGEDYDGLADTAEVLVERMRENADFGNVRLEYATTQPQLFVQIDRNRASDLGVDITGLGNAIRAVLDGRSVGSVFVGDTSHDIQMLSTSNPVDDPGDLENIFVRTGGGEMVPMSSFVSLEERAVAPELERENQRRAVEIEANLTPGFALGDALAEVDRLAEDVLEDNQSILPLAEAATLDETSNGLILTFGFAVLIVFLVLSAQFESFISAIVVMATVPLGLACAIFAMAATGLSLNLYSQIGLVLLIGIMAKNGILIVEFANQLRDGGAGVRDAIVEACAVRLRPVMMTMTSTVLGGVPLILSAGAGAEAREALGWVIVGGLGLATLSTLYLTPVAFYLLARFSKPRAAEQAQLQAELAAAR